MSLPDPLDPSPGDAKDVPNMGHLPIKQDLNTLPPKLRKLAEISIRMGYLRSKMKRAQPHADRLAEKTKAATDGEAPRRNEESIGDDDPNGMKT